jgi:hypothetical protein
LSSYTEIGTSTKQKEIIMVEIGKNISGETLMADATGTRSVLKDGKVVGTCSITGGTFDAASSSRYVPALDFVEATCRNNDQGTAGIGAAAAFRALSPHWKEHLAEGHSPDIIARDILAVQAQLTVMLAELGFSPALAGG